MPLTIEKVQLLHEANIELRVKHVTESEQYDLVCEQLDGAVGDGKIDAEVAAFATPSVLADIKHLEDNAKKLRVSFGAFLARYAPSAGPIPAEINYDYTVKATMGVARGK